MCGKAEQLKNTSTLMLQAFPWTVVHKEENLQENAEDHSMQ